MLRPSQLMKFASVPSSSSRHLRVSGTRKDAFRPEHPIPDRRGWCCARDVTLLGHVTVILGSDAALG